MLFSMFRTFAHGGEEHSSSVADVAHRLPWYIQPLVFLFATAVIAAIVWIVFKNSGIVLLAVSLSWLVSGFVFYSAAPVLSALAITAGLVMTLGTTLLSLSVKK